MEITNREIYELLVRLERKVDKLNEDVSKLKINKQKHQDVPNQTIQEWIEEATVSNEDIKTLLSSQDGTLEAFKKFIISNNDSKKIPLMNNGKRLNVYSENDGEKNWRNCNDENVQYIIRETWRKFLQHYLSSIDYSMDVEVIDIQKLKVMQMRKNLYEVDKNKKELIKWFQEIL